MAIVSGCSGHQSPLADGSGDEDGESDDPSPVSLTVGDEPPSADVDVDVSPGSGSFELPQPASVSPNASAARLAASFLRFSASPIGWSPLTHEARRPLPSYGSDSSLRNFV
ncbi:hypothetical protein ACFOLD_10665 [Kocuria carniphila]|uniref:hypothetical protein n=1 Tax=Kocuria carniphila TaxID=262208 RepID=UPI0036111F80